MHSHYKHIQNLQIIPLLLHTHHKCKKKAGIEFQQKSIRKRYKCALYSFQFGKIIKVDVVKSGSNQTSDQKKCENIILSTAAKQTVFWQERVSAVKV